ncbi:MAG: SDR family oxidoreductase [Rhizobiales bacterium]|nr:SDR family oxidoreductase [Hyphomicrobiales bacterium]NRB12900.1 SDR family oxidoreductase [Hyphomicrobiales bacterium]
MSEPLKITLLGATGAVGRLYLDLALNAGYQVVALVRDSAKLEQRDGLTIIQGDTKNADDVAAATVDVNVIVSCVGETKEGPVMELTARSVLAAARTQESPPKTIFISSLGCGGTSWIVKLLSILMGGRQVFDDYNKADALISNEQTVPYVLVRPTGLTDEAATGKYAVYKSGVTFVKRISRSDMAQFLFDATTKNDWDGQGGFQLGG